MALFGEITTLKLPHGSLRVVHLQSGKRQGPSCGFMGNVRLSIRQRAIHIDP